MVFEKKKAITPVIQYLMLCFPPLPTSQPNLCYLLFRFHFGRLMWCSLLLWIVSKQSSELENQCETMQYHSRHVYSDQQSIPTDHPREITPLTSYFSKVAYTSRKVAHAVCAPFSGAGILVPVSDPASRCSSRVTAASRSSPATVFSAIFTLLLYTSTPSNLAQC